MTKVVLLLAVLLCAALEAQVPCTIAKTGPSARPDSTSLPVVFLLGDKGDYAEQIGTAHRVMIFYPYGLDDRSEIGGDTLSVPLYNVMTDFPAQGIIRIYNSATGFIVSTIDSARVLELRGVFPGDTFLISWNPDNPATGIEKYHLPVSGRIQTLRLSPNPFNPNTFMKFTLSIPTFMNVSIYDPTGKLVHTLFNGRKSGGPHTLTWNGCDAYGRLQKSGRYLLRLKTPEHTQTTMLTLIK